MDVSSIQDILQGAEVLVAKIHADQDLPRVVRNIPQLLAEGKPGTLSGNVSVRVDVP